MSLMTLVVPREILLETHAFLRQNSLFYGIEAVVLWRGTSQGFITQMVVPKQRAGSGRFSVSLAERQNIARSLRGSGELIIAQVHTHPGEAFHSRTDDKEAIPRVVGAFSLVIPEFASRDFVLDDAALYQLQEDGTWLAMPLQALHVLDQPSSGRVHE